MSVDIVVHDKQTPTSNKDIVITLPEDPLQQLQQIAQQIQKLQQALQIQPSTPTLAPPQQQSTASSSSSASAPIFGVPKDYGDIRRRIFPHARPQADSNYFFELPKQCTTELGIIIPMYNEPYIALKKTLISIHEQMKYIYEEDCKVTTPHVMIILDMWSETSPDLPQITHHTTKAYLKALFDCGENIAGWSEELEDLSTRKNTPHQTFVIQRTKKNMVTLVDVNFTVDDDGFVTKGTAEKVKMLITLVVKRDNRKKHNSHEWFFGENGFGWYYRPTYLFATDCGTLFDKDCMRKLIYHMEAHKEVSAVTGRQRVMSKSQQESDESLFSLGTLLRGAQRFDYESSFACYMGTFALVGFLPVIPGPCGLYRTNIMLPPSQSYKTSPASWYFDVVNTDPDKSGLVLGNLRIAEDRVLSYAAVLKAPCYARMALVPEAVFYFEAELELEPLALQRRRWINGTWAGYFYLAIQKPGLLFNNPHISTFRATLIWLLLTLQLLVYCVVAVSPSIFLTALRLTITAFFPNDDTFIPSVVWFLLVAYYVFFVAHHARNKYETWMFYSWLLISATITICSFVSLISYIIHHLDIVTDVYFPPSYLQLTVWMVFAVFVFPLLLALMHSPSSLAMMLASVIPYYLFLPMITGIFGAYAFSRSWDLTWGNRPSAGSVASEMKDTVVRKIKGKANTICAFIVFLNMGFFLVEVYVGGESASVFWLVVCVFISALVQMLFGIFFFLFYDLKRIGQFFVTQFFFCIGNRPPPVWICCGKLRKNWRKKQKQIWEEENKRDLEYIETIKIMKSQPEYQSLKSIVDELVIRNDDNKSISVTIYNESE